VCIRGERMRRRVFSICQEAVSDITDGATVMIGGWGSPGDLPQNLILALYEHGAKDLTIICNGGSTGQIGVAACGRSYMDTDYLIANNQVKKYILSISFPGTFLERDCLSGKLEVEWVPQGTLAERIRAGGAGIGGFYTKVGVGTVVATGKEKRVINGEEHILETPLRANYALIRAYMADRYGNLIYRGSSRTFNTIMATAADTVIVEVEKILQPGELDPNHIVTPEIFVDRIVEVPPFPPKLPVLPR
jgi:3-oxoacid CoA-transferase A subunit